MGDMLMPKICKIDKKIFEKMCNMWCTKEEIAYMFDCSEDTIERWCKKEYKRTFSSVYNEHRTWGCYALRRNQLELSKKNASMAIFLGKNYLGQSDNVKIEHSGGVNIVNDIPIPESLKEDEY